MTDRHSSQSLSARPNDFFESPLRRSAASYERALEKSRQTELGLRDALARDEALLRRKDELIEQQQILGKESDHRLLNGMQLIVSLLSLQSRTSSNAEVASQLTRAAIRVAMIAHVHKRLHYLDDEQTVAFKRYLEGLCHDFSAMLSLDERAEQVLVVEGAEANLPTSVGIPLSFIVSELITNAAKYGQGWITVKLEQTGSGTDYALSVSNDGPVLPEGFDPSASTGLGMRIVESFVKQIGGTLRIDRSDHDQGTRFSVLFSAAGK